MSRQVSPLASLLCRLHSLEQLTLEPEGIALLSARDLEEAHLLLDQELGQACLLPSITAQF